MNKSEGIKELAAALCKARAGFTQFGRDKTVVVKTRTGGQYTFSYAPLETILDSVVPALTENGLMLLQEVSEGKVTTTVLHSSGEWMASGGTVIKVAEEGAQAFGSGLTYARRYDLTLFLGLSADDDDDANAANGNEVSKAAGKAPHKPSDGALESLSVDQQTFVKDVAEEVKVRMAGGKTAEACKWFAGANFDAESKVACWALLPSHYRTAMKKYMDAHKTEAKEEAAI